MSSDSMDSVPGSLDDVLITAVLKLRPAQPPDYVAENRALAALAEAMVATPESILQKLVQAAFDLCRADSAGISILESAGREALFRCHAARSGGEGWVHPIPSMRASMKRQLSLLSYGDIRGCRQIRDLGSRIPTLGTGYWGRSWQE
jgi:hypothetical protein